jgi:hypothetical protein
MVVSILQIQSALNCLMNEILVHDYIFQILERCHVFIEAIKYLFFMISSCILLTRNQHRFLCVYFYTNFLTNID